MQFLQYVLQICQRIRFILGWLSDVQSGDQYQGVRKAGVFLQAKWRVHIRRINTEEKAKVVAAVLGT